MIKLIRMKNLGNKTSSQHCEGNLIIE